MSRQLIPKYAVGILRDALVPNEKSAIQMGIAVMLTSSAPFYYIHFMHVIQGQRFLQLGSQYSLSVYHQIMWTP